MNIKCKNPYLDSSIDGISAFLFGCKMLNIGLNITDGAYGHKKNGAIFIELTTKEIFDDCINKEVFIYEFMPECIPDGMRYHKELYKLVPDIIEDKKSVADEYISGINLKNHRTYNIGSSNYASMNIQPWDIWKDWKLDPWDGDIIKRISRTKEIPGKTFEEARIEDYEKIKHICDEKLTHSNNTDNTVLNRKIYPKDIIEDWKLNSCDSQIISYIFYINYVLVTTCMTYEFIKNLCDIRILQLKEAINAK